VIEESWEERLARLEKAVVSSLELLERGLVQEARLELARAAAASQVPPPAEFSEGVSDQELERAFETAEPELDGMLHADRVAQIAMREADEALAAELAPGEVGTAFETQSMADLLERQGDAASAGRIRARLAQPLEPAPVAVGAKGARTGRPGRQQVIATLERWLENLRGGARP
jgi:hypothetical protein